MSFWVTDEGSKHGKKDEELIKESQEKENITIPKEKQIECPKCKTLNEPNCVECISCGENMVALKQQEIKDYSVLRQVDKKRKH